MKYEGVNKLIIKTKSGHEILIDDSDWDKVKDFTWYVNKRNEFNTYAIAFSSDRTGILLHSFLMNPPKGKVIDHIDGNGLNNQRSNLRVCTHAQNLRNQRKNTNYGHSKYKGVTFSQAAQKWVGQIKKDYKLHYLGLFPTEKEAAIAYNKAAKKLHGKFALLNEIA